MGMEDYRREREWNRLLRKEQKYLAARWEQRDNFLNDSVEKFMPDNLQSVLEKAFVKGFQIIFEKGTTLIEHTYNKEKIQNDYKVNAYAASLKKGKDSMRPFARNARHSQTFHLALSAVEGTAMGAFGVGVPDIPVFLGVLLRSIYEMAMHYGFSYRTLDEQMFILRVIEASMCRGRHLQRRDIEINRWIDKELQFSECLEEQIERTAQALSEALLYMKFVQTIPIVGIVGGAMDVWCLNEVTTYAQLKYQRRFLTDRDNV